MKIKLLQIAALMAFSFCLPSSAFSDEKMLIEWSATDKEFPIELRDVIEEAVEFINDTYRFNRSLTVHFGAEDGPLYDPQLDEIQMPYEFYSHVVSLFAQLQPDDKSLQEEFAIDTMLHTLFHEYGHAVIDQFEIPVLGKEEDAVDALASVLLIEYYRNGAEMAINAAELFALESDERGSLQEADFWDEHSLDEQRYYGTLCHVVGSDVEEYQELAESAGFSTERIEGCVFEYQQLVNDWDTQLEPALR